MARSERMKPIIALRLKVDAGEIQSLFIMDCPRFELFHLAVLHPREHLKAVVAHS